MRAEDCLEENYNYSEDGQTITISPGTYCGGINVSGNNNTIIFEPGVYILAGGGFDISGAGNILQNETDSGIGGVMFFNSETDDGSDDFSDISFAGDNDVILSAPTSGDYAGVLFFQDPDSDSAAASLEFSVSGEVDMQLDGAVYLPDHDIDYSGTSSMSLRCTKLIGNTIEFSGTTGTDIPDSCASDAVTISNTTGVRLRG